jgi:hypothetical protein
VLIGCLQWFSTSQQRAHDADRKLPLSVGSTNLLLIDPLRARFLCSLKGLLSEHCPSEPDETREIAISRANRSTALERDRGPDGVHHDPACDAGHPA